MTRLVRLLAAVGAAAVTAAGCGFHGVYSLPLPGAAANGGNTYTVDVQLADVLDLVPYSAVKVNGATVGHVQSIKVEGRHALVSCRLRDSVKLPVNSIARLEQTSVLGEKFVEIEPPHDQVAYGDLRRAESTPVIPLARTDTDASVEEVLGALSMLLNGGGVAQLQTITHEVSTALRGRTGVTRDLLHHLNTFAAAVDRQKHAIITALQGLDDLARTVRAQEHTIVSAVEEVPAAVRILADDRDRLRTMLTSVGRLGQVAGHVIEASHDDLVANLRNLEPTLGQLAKVGTEIPKILGVVLTYPTADSVEQEYFGDYGNLSLTLDVSSKSLLKTFGPGLAQHAAAHPDSGPPPLRDLLSGGLQ